MMHLIKLTKDNTDYTFCTNGKIMVLETVNVPRLFKYKSDAANYIYGYIDHASECGYIFDYTWDFIEVGEKEISE